MVHDVCADQHILKINPDCISEACHIDNRAVCIRLDVVPHPGLSCVYVPHSKEIYSSAEEWHPPAVQTGIIYSDAACSISTVGPPFELLRHVQNPVSFGDPIQGPS